MLFRSRAKLGKKYIDLDLYHSPWWVRFKVWCEEKKKNYAEYKRDKRQANIDRQKKKAELLAEKEKIDSEIYAYEQKENEELSKKKQEELDKQANAEAELVAKKEEATKTEDAKVLNKENEGSEKTVKPSNIPVKKYSKTVKNTKAANRKKKK